jgi:hypothetical protein
VLSVVVRWEPTLTVVNGTLVARPGEVRPGTRWCRWLAARSQGEFVLGDHCIVGKPRTRRGSVLRSRPAADACGAPVLPDQGPDWPAGA